MPPVRRIVFGAIAGQPALPLARVLALAADRAGWPAALFDLHAVRPGSTETHLNLAASFGNPRVARGACDLVVGLEVLEGLRQLARHFRPGLRLVALEVTAPPAAVARGERCYPDLERVAAALAGEARIYRLPGPGRHGAPAEPAHLASVLGAVAGLVRDLDHRSVRRTAREVFPGWPAVELERGYALGLEATTGKEGA